MSQNTSLTPASKTNYQPTEEGTIPMLNKRIFLTLLIIGVIAISTTMAQARSASRKSWSRSNSINHYISPAPDQATDQKSATELQTASLESKKMAIVGSWLTPLGIGIRVVN